MTVDRARLLGLTDEELMLTWEFVSDAIDADFFEDDEAVETANKLVEKWHDIMHGQPAGPECRECMRAYHGG